MKFCLMNLQKAFVMILLLTCAFAVNAQEAKFKDGVQLGVVKVKFTPEMAATMSQVKISTRNNVLSTGITSFDKTVSKFNATGMRRAFRDTPKNAAKLRKHGLHLWYIMEIDENVNPKDAISALKQLKEVDVAECEFQKVLPPTKILPYKPMATKASGDQPFNDPYLKDQWHYNNVMRKWGTTNAISDINLFEAWKMTAGRADVIVSVHDEGVDVNHEDLKENIWVNKKEIPGNGIDDDGNGYIDDVNGYDFYDKKGPITAEKHGTHVAGTIAAVNNNNKGVSGVAGGTGKGDGVKIMSLRTLGFNANRTGMAESYVYAAENGAVISQNSWGFTDEGDVEDMIEDAIKYFIAEAGDYEGSPMKGGIVIFAAGNKNSEGYWFPPRYDAVMAVAATGPEGKKAGYSNFGTWVEISAPGGDYEPYEFAAGGAGAILSTLPNNEYGYNQGTSMACPHVSGVAALILANSPQQLTNDQLWKRIMNSGRNIDEANPGYEGKMGVGLIDAAAAIRNDIFIAPVKTNDLTVKEILQDNATLEWTVAKDEDDGKPAYFEIYYHTNPITKANLSAAIKSEMGNNKEAGEKITATVEGLLGKTQYYFAVISVDKWDNKSILSNVASGKCDIAPAIAVDINNAAKIELTTNVNDAKTATFPFKILNNSDGILQWGYDVRNTGWSASYTGYSAANIVYPAVNKNVALSDYRVNAMKPVGEITTIAKAKTRSGMEATETIKDYGKGILGTQMDMYIGDYDISIPISSAVKYIVTEEEGFNLTHLQFNLNYKLGTGPLTIEIYKDKLDKRNIVYAINQRMIESFSAGYVEITFPEYIYFEKDTEFYIAIHMPAGNRNPLRTCEETHADYSKYCYISYNVGETWTPLEEYLAPLSTDVASKAVWTTKAISKYGNIEKFITLNPVSGDIAANSDMNVSLIADGSQLINGNYKTNLIVRSNDVSKKEVRVPVEFNVAGQKPNIIHPDVVEFGNVFVGTDSILDIELENQGFGLINNLGSNSGITGSSDFSIVGYIPSSISAKSTAKVRVMFKPTSEGNINGELKISNGNAYNYSIPLFGTGMGSPEIKATPKEVSFDNVTIGDKLKADIEIKNEGAYPLKYFVPRFDDKGMDEKWPTKYHSHGYVVRSNDPNVSKNTDLEYEFNDISDTGVDITNDFTRMEYRAVPFGFGFPFYDGIQDTIYITDTGYTTFDTSRIPQNTPKLEGAGPIGYISMLGFNTNVKWDNGKILYKSEPDRMIIQYTDADYEFGTFTAQMVLYSNGNIRFYYKTIPTTEFNAKWVIVLIEDMKKKDGILIRDNYSDFFIGDGTVIGFDYPGPEIISSIENASGIIKPNETATVSVYLSTENLFEGESVRYVNFINNDPANPIESPRIKLNVTSGGVNKSEISTDAIDFGTIYKGHPYKNTFRVSNKGTRIMNVTLDHDASKFKITGAQNINPGTFFDYIVEPVTTGIALLEDNVVINYGSGGSDQISLNANVLNPPIIKADLTEIERTLGLEEKVSIPFTIENDGESELEYTAISSTWLGFEELTPRAAVTYDYKIEGRKGDATHRWIDITKTGTLIPYQYQVYWTKLDLPFTFSFYGVEYNTLNLGVNGLVAFGSETPTMPNHIVQPIEDTSRGYLYPAWTMLGFEPTDYPGSGLYYQAFDDKFILTWEYALSFVGGGPLSLQVILYRDGTIKYQYVNRKEPESLTGGLRIGLQKPNSTEYINLSNQKSLEMGTAYLFSPANSYAIPAKGSISGNIQLDATRAYAGEFNDKLTIRSNDPVNPLIEKPIKISISGSAEMDIAESLDFGRMKALTAYSDYYELPLNITNTGSGMLTITNIRREKGDQNLTQTLWYTSSGPWGMSAFTPIENIFNGFDEPEYNILPGDMLESYARFKPYNVSGDFEETLIITTNVGEKRVTLKGTAYVELLPNINVSDLKPIKASFTAPEQTEVRTIDFDNNAGKGDLEYNVTIDYKRLPKEESEPIQDARIVADNIGTMPQLMKVENATEVRIETRSDVEFNRVLDYCKDLPFMGDAIGVDAFTRLETATKFNGGTEGFNLSDVGCWFVPLNQITEGFIEVEIIGGDSKIGNGFTIGKGRLDFELDPNASIFGGIVNIPLDEEILIYPNEDFFVVIKYPLGLSMPQGAVIDPEIEVMPDRFFLKYNGVWIGTQYSLIGFEHGAFMVYAGERTAKESKEWLKIKTNQTGSVPVGEGHSFDIEFIGSTAAEGSQNAYVVINSNDVKNPKVEILASLYMNQAPIFTGISKEVTVAEEDTKTFNIMVSDPDFNSFNVEAMDNNPGFISGVYADEVLKLTVNPKYGNAGIHTAKFKATDEHNASRELSIDIRVDKTNRAPVYVSDITQLLYTIENKEVRYSINDFFADPDGDSFTFVAEAGNESIISVLQSKDEFIVIPKVSGTTVLNFIVTDVDGGIATHSINVTVDILNSISSDELNLSLKVYPNPVKEGQELTIETQLPDLDTKPFTIRIMNMHGQVISESSITQRISKINMALKPGLYLIKMFNDEAEKTFSIMVE